MRVHIFIILLSIVILSSCKKDNDPQGTTPPSRNYNNGCPKPALPLKNPRLLQCKFQPGSYWVFLDSISNLFDTLYVETINRKSANLPYVGAGPCDSAEVYALRMVFKNEMETPVKTFRYLVYEYGVMYENDYIWTVGGSNQGSTIFYLANKSMGTGYKEWDSLFIYNTYYRRVAESDEIKLTKNETTMFHLTVKNYFNADFGPLQFDYHDFLTHELKNRYKLIASHLIRE